VPGVLICDDSATMRLALRRVLLGNGFVVAAEAANGEDAVALARRLKPDLITMDVMLPGVDGFEATKAILKDGPARIVMVSAAGEALQADLGFRALQSGALDLVDKPVVSDPGRLAAWGKEFCGNLKALASLPLGERRDAAAVNPKPKFSVTARSVAALGIVSSTGGPPALAALLGDVSPSLPFPILVAQHIAPGFTEGLARWLGTQTGLAVRVASGGETADPGTVWLAKDRNDLLWRAGRLRVVPNDGGVCPNGDRLLASLAMELGPRAAGAVLTGMGSDGAEGLLRLRACGGLTFAQDAASCVVDGMPARAVALGATQQRLTLEELCFCVSELGRRTGGPVH
jgi:two-component system chemotaxis response regulator CheB